MIMNERREKRRKRKKVRAFIHSSNLAVQSEQASTQHRITNSCGSPEVQKLRCQAWLQLQRTSFRGSQPVAHQIYPVPLFPWSW
jgi:hypothetical protein